MVRALRFMGIVLFSATLIISCQGERNKEPEEITIRDAATGTDTETEKLAEGAGQGGKENIVRFALARTGGPWLDPHSVQGDLELNFNPNVYEGLLKIKPDTGALIPALAESYEWITPEIVEFRLRRGVTFHNGESFTADAVKFSFERMAAVTEGFNWIRMVAPEFEQVEILGPYRIRIHLSRHNSVFLMSSRFFPILPPGYLEEYGTEYFLKHPVGTGPFRVTKIDYEGSVVQTIYMEKNEDYWDEGKPYLDGLIYYFGMTQKECLETLYRGGLDGMGDLPIRNILDVRKAGFAFHQRGQGLITWLYFNLTDYKKDSPLWNPQVRKAMVHSIDYDRIREVVYNNRASQNNQWAFPGIPGYAEDGENYSYDPDLARQLMKEAGYEEGFRLQAYCDDVNFEEAKILQASFAAIGIDVQFDLLDEGTNNCVLGAWRNPESPCRPLLEKYDFMLGDFGWGLPHNFVSHLHTFSLESMVSLMSSDYPGALDTVEMMNDAKSTFGEAEAREKWENITLYELDRLGICGLMLKETYYTTVENLHFPVYGSYDFTEARYESD